MPIQELELQNYLFAERIRENLGLKLSALVLSAGALVTFPADAAFAADGRSSTASGGAEGSGSDSSSADGEGGTDGGSSEDAGDAIGEEDGQDSADGKNGTSGESSASSVSESGDGEPGRNSIAPGSGATKPSTAAPNTSAISEGQPLVDTKKPTTRTTRPVVKQPQQIVGNGSGALGGSIQEAAPAPAEVVTTDGTVFRADLGPYEPIAARNTRNNAPEEDDHPEGILTGLALATVLGIKFRMGRRARTQENI